MGWSPSGVRTGAPVLLPKGSLGVPGAWPWTPPRIATSRRVQVVGCHTCAGDIRNLVDKNQQQMIHQTRPVSTAGGTAGSWRAPRPPPRQLPPVGIGRPTWVGQVATSVELTARDDRRPFTALARSATHSVCAARCRQPPRLDGSRDARPQPKWRLGCRGRHLSFGNSVESK